jgi:hypothetical protein
MPQPQTVRRRIEERPVAHKPLGRHVAHDPRSLTYQAAQARTIRSVRHQAHGLPLDQTRGSCTAEALCGALDSAPDFRGTIRRQADADQLYDAEIVLEGGNPATDDPGGSGLEVCKAAKQLGWIRRYESAFGLDHALKALTLRPVITGVNWYDSFDTPPANGLVAISRGAEVRGGHELLADEIVLDRRLVGLWNSWGPWGLAGRFYWTFDTWERLLHESGDVTVPLI